MSSHRPISPGMAERPGDDSVVSGSRSRLNESISPAMTRELVLNYLVHHCYLDTALAFAGDGIAAEGSSGLDVRSKSQPPGSSKRPGLGAGVVPPPLARGDSSTEMEIEVDEALAMAAELNGTTQAARQLADKTLNGKGKGRDDLHKFASGLEGHENVGELSGDDIFQISIRRDIRDHILSGRIYAAIELLDEHFPAVVSSSAAAGRLRRSEASPQTLDPSSVYARLSGGLASSVNASNGASGAASGNGKSGRPKAALPAYRPSLDPDHVALNLQIQAFIEAVRGSSGTGTTRSVGDSSATGRLSPFSDAGSSAGSTNGSANATGAGGGGIMGALALVQGINTRVLSLPEYWRSMYLKELQGVTALLAYANVESSPVSKYLDQKRRVGLAEQVNSAIIAQSGQPSQPLIESTIRQTTFVWGQIAADKVPVPPSHLAFIGGDAGTSGDPEGFQKLSHLESTHGTANANGSSLTGASSDPRKNRGRILPPWDLHSFLADR
ncbi:GLUCOSE-INDUCED DEGRADATION PROTEIN 8 HOMOLOG [Ceraceosorus bombacis]|uniref:GLUCOSE-INDUCED DEGRADATION PROTEIN 8 HOMOLOG n=1 Tax=Ceraceosorus bombacis TaxID=401625 RepID=A0A0P1BT80_9BASI|nr:GLUCOSE-INDUCED DEGRADATION PROTEIN 8 HOMOLOG [Ceraceosorus bombacis]